MPICKNCEVEFDTSLIHCPLCDTPQGQENHKFDANTQVRYNPGYEPLTSKEKSRIFWEVAGLFDFSALVVVLLIDLILTKRIGWSSFAMTSLVTSFIYITLIVFTTRKLWLFLGGLFLNTVALLLLLDFFDGGINWFLAGLPIAGSFVFLLGLVMAFIYYSKEKGFNIIAFAAIAIGIFCISVEVIIRLNAGQALSLSWSIIVATALLPFALILLFMHYRLKRGTSLRKFFHL